MSQVQPGYLLSTLPCEFVAYLILLRRADHTQRARPNGESNLTLLQMTSKSSSFQVRHGALQYIHSSYTFLFPQALRIGSIRTSSRIFLQRVRSRVCLGISTPQV